MEELHKTYFLLLTKVYKEGSALERFSKDSHHIGFSVFHRSIVRKLVQTSDVGKTIQSQSYVLTPTTLINFLISTGRQFFFLK